MSIDVLIHNVLNAQVLTLLNKEEFVQFAQPDMRSKTKDASKAVETEVKT